MGRSRRAIGVALIGTVLTSLAWAAEPFKIGVVDQQAVLQRTKAGKQALDELQEFRTARQRIVSSDDEELKRLEKELREQEGALTEAAKREKQEQFRSKLESYQRRFQDFNREIEAKQRAFAEEYQKKIEAATATVAQRGAYSLVMEKGSEATLRIVLYATTPIDLTDQVVKEFDRQNK